MEPNRWLKDEADERLLGLFSDDPLEVHGAIRELVELADADSEIEELLADTLQSSIDEENDDTQASIWIAVILGEVGAESSLPVLLASLSSNDELLAATAVRSLQRMGRPAFEVILDRLDEDEDIEPAHFAAVCEVLEGIQLHSLPDVRARLENCLIEHLRRSIASGPPLARDRLRTVETAAITLARLGVARARTEVDQVSTVTGGTNSFVLEAIEIMDDQPRGIPLPGSGSWESEFEWANEGQWLADPSDAGDEAAASGLELSVEDTEQERILRLRRRSR